MKGFKMLAWPVVAAALAGTSPAQGITVYVNGEPVVFNGAGPRQLQGRVMVPLRGVMEKLGAFVAYQPETKSVVASKGDIDLQLRLGDSFAMVNGQRTMLDVPAQSYLGSTMVPLRFMSEALGAQVQWDAPTMAVRIVTGTEAGNNTQPERPQPIGGGNNAVSISRFESNRSSYSRAGQKVTFTLEGTRGGTATMEIPGVIPSTNMREVSPGKYQATITIPDDDLSISKASPIARLRVGQNEQVQQATNNFRVDTQPPVLRNPSPEGNTRISRTQPNISVSFEDLNGSGIDTKQVRMWLDGREVTEDANIRANGLFYRPANQLAPGQHTVRVTARDKAGNQVEREWSFTIGQSRDVLNSINHTGGRSVQPGQVVKFTVKGEPGSTVTYSIGNKIVDLPTREVSPGVYEGEYTVRLGDDLADTPVIARLKNKNGETYTVEGTQVLGEGATLLMKPTITSPETTRAVGSNVVNIQGKAGRRAKVQVTVEYETSLLGLLPIRGTLSEKTVFADANGNWETGDINLQNNTTGAGTTFKVTAVAIGENDQKSESTTITFKR